VTICIQYDDTGMELEEEQALTLYHFVEGSGWVPVPSIVDVINNRVCGTVTSFSLFAILYSPDETPPEISGVSASPEVLWPANHKMVEVTVTVEAADNSGHVPMSATVKVECNESEDSQGDGNTEPDWEYTDDPLVVLLKAERAGGGNGRIYTITVACVDPSGNASSETVEVAVPRDQGKGKSKKK